MTDDVTEEPLTDEMDSSPADDAAESTSDTDATNGPAPQYGVGPFSIREVSLVGVWLVAFIVSFFSVSTGPFNSVWTSGLLWILTIFVPSLAVFLLVLRRLSPDGIRRVGSLGIDQFASVAFSVSAVIWLQLVWDTVAFAISGGLWLYTWVMWVQFALMLAGVVLTVFAPVLPVLGEDFRHRREIPAHRNARPIRPVTARPAPEPKPTAIPDEQNAPEAYAATSYDPVSYNPDTASANAYDTGGYDLDETATSSRGENASWAPVAEVNQSRYESAEPAAVPVAAEPVSQQPVGQQPVSQQPFWALAATERDVHDAQGSPLFRIGPTAWALVIEDRGSVYIVRHEDGRIGYLHDVSAITRG